MLQSLFDALLASAASAKQYARGDYIFHRDDAVRSVYLLASGHVRLTRFQADGGTLILHRAQGPRIIAEASLYSATYHCDCICDSAAGIHAIPLTTAHQVLTADPGLARQWTAYLAHELQAARRHCELLTHKKVSDRLASWLDWHGELPEKGEWKILAAELNVSPEALYREISRRHLD